MKRTALALLIALSAFAVQARAPADPVAPAETAEAAPVATDAETQAAPEAVAEKTRERNCVRETGSRIPRRDRDGCNGQPGESYTGEELRRTGASNPAEALRLLSPRVGG